MDDLHKFLDLGILVEEPNKLEMDLKKLFEKNDFMKLIKENVTKGEVKNEN
jgi:hypothetical protein